MRAGAFLQRLWADTQIEGSVLLWEKSTRYPNAIPVEEVRSPTFQTDLDGFITNEVSKRHELYVSPGLRLLGLPERGKGSAGGVRQICAFRAGVVDFDIHDPTGISHRTKKRLPRSVEDIAAILDGVPEPTFVIDTGYGMHLWWLFHNAWELPDYAARQRAQRWFRDFQEPIIARAQSLDFHVDSTGSISFWFRLPDTTNFKGNTGRPVVLVHEDTVTYDPDDLVLRGRSRTRPLAKEIWDDYDSDGDPFGECASSSESEEEISLSVRLDRIRSALKTFEADEEHKIQIDAVIAGESFAESERDTAMTLVTWAIICHVWDLKPTPIEIAELLRPSLAVWASEDGASKTLDEEIAKVIDKAGRGIEKKTAQDERLRRDAAAILPSFRRAGVPVVAEDVPAEQIIRAGIIQKGSYYFILDFGAQITAPPMRPGYYGPFIKDEIFTRCKDAWEGAPAPYCLDYMTKATEKKPSVKALKTTLRLMQEYGSSALDVVSDLSLQDSFFDLETRVFHEAVCPLRVMEPEYDSLVDEWLRIFGGEDVDKLIDWVACITRLDQPCCAIYIEGPPSVGKNLFANGLARLWTTSGPSSFERLMGGFNADMVRSPEVLLDEGLPPGRSTSAFMRNLVGSIEHTINQKYMPMRKLRGAPRVVITANNDGVLGQLANEDLSEKDIDAVVERFLHIRSPPEAAEWIADHNQGKVLTTRWVEGDAIARHALWLRDNRSVVFGRRFLVEGTPTEIHRALVTRGDRRGAVLEWLARCLTDPTKVERVYATKRAEPLVIIGNGHFLVNTQALVECWSLFREPEQRLTPAMIGRILGQISTKIRVGPRGSERIRYHNVNVDHVLDWAGGDAQVGDVIAMRENLARVLSETKNTETDKG